MLTQGPIPVAVHGVIEYGAGVLFVVAPFLFDFSGGATALAVLLGFVILAFAAATGGPTGLIDQISVRTHAGLDYVLALFLLLSPYVFGFSGETAPTAFFIALGVAHLLVTVGTRFLRGTARL
ncbi:MAG: hypothetical protein ACRDZ9_08125 [Acidimicrobiales bacterium]